MKPPAPLDAAYSGQPAKLYGANYESSLLRGTEEQRPWDLQAEIKQLLKPSSHLLDIGCGTAFKVIPLAPLLKQIVGLEPSEPMRTKAIQNAQAAGVKNIRIFDGIAAHLPFADESFDVVTNILSPDNADEILRVLKPGGVAILEKLGDQDKAELKSFFRSDEQGPRGKYGDVPAGERLRTYERIYKERFNVVRTREGFWNTYFTPEGLQFLLETNSDIRDFHPSRDAATMQEVANKLMSDRGIVVVQHRFVLIARKPK
jgi:SAM-dependent methyltransferase